MSRMKKVTQAHSNPDHHLIVDCLSVATHLAAIQAAFKTDPDESNKYAEKFDDRHSEAARRILKRVSADNARPIPGLMAQARLLPMLLDDEEGSVIQKSTLTFVRSFAVSVDDYFKQIINGLHADVGGKVGMSPKLS